MKHKKWHLVCLLIAFANIAPSASSQLAKVSDDLSILARIVKGITIGETLDKEPSKLDSLVGEVLNLGHGVTMDTLANGKMGGLDTDLGAIGMAVEKQCGGRNGCADVAGIVHGIKVLEEIGMKLAEVENVIQNDASPLKQIIDLKKHFETLISAGKRSGELIEKIDSLKTVAEDDFTTVFLMELKKLLNDMNNSEGNFTAINSLSPAIKFDGFEKDIQVIDSLGIAPIQFGTVIDEMKSGLSEIRQKIGVLKPLIATSTSGDINEKLDLLTNLIETQSVHGDVDYLNELTKDARSGFVVKMFGNGEKVEESLAELLKPIQTRRQKLEPLRNSWQAVGFSQTMHGAVANLKSELESVGRDMNNPVLDSIASIKSPETCFGKMNLAAQFNSIAPAVLKDLETHIASYQNKEAKTTPFAGLVEFEKFAELLDNIGTSTEEHKKKLQELKQVDDQTKDKVKQELNAFKTHIDTFESVALYKLLDKVPIEKVSSEVNNWMKKSGIQTAMDCLKAHPTVTSSKLSSVSFTSLLNLKSESYVVKSVMSILSALKTSLVEWNKIKSSQTPTKPKRAAKKSLQNAEKLSKELSEGVKIIRNMAEVQKKQVVIEKLVAAEATISTAVSGVKDPAKKGQIDKIWTDATKKSLKALPDTVNKLEKSIDKSPETISDYQKVFSSAKALSYPNINTKDLESALDTITDPPGIQSTLHSIATLDLQFVDAEKRLTAASGALGPLQKFFDDVIGADGAVGAQKQVGGTAMTVTEATSLMNPLVIVFIILFVLALIAIAVLVFLRWKEKKEGGDKKTDKKTNKKTDKKNTGKGKDVEKGKTSGKTGGKTKGKSKKSKGSTSSGTASVAAQPAPAGQNPNPNPAPPAQAPAPVAPAPNAPAPAQDAAPARDAPEAPSQDQPAPTVENPAEGNEQNAPEPRAVNLSEDNTLRGTPEIGA